jgi:hypothetical protein
VEIRRRANRHPESHLDTGSLRPFVLAALILIALIVLTASLAAFAESYRGLYQWALHHGLHGRWAIIWPIQLDAFIAVGELALFVAMAAGWRRRDRIAAWAVTGAGLAASVAANVGHLVHADLPTRGTDAVPPVVAAGMLAVGLGVLKRVVAMRQPAAIDVPSPPAAEPAGQPTSEPTASPPSRPTRPRRQPTATPARKTAAKRQEAVVLLQADPGMSGAGLAARVGVNERTGQRWRNDILSGVSVLPDREAAS